MAVGDECTAIALAGMLAAYMKVDPDQLYQTIEQLSTQGQNEAPGATDAPEPNTQEGNAQVYVTWDIARGLCGFRNPNGTHCHRKAMHSGKHGSAGDSECTPDAIDAGALVATDGRESDLS